MDDLLMQKLFSHDKHFDQIEKDLGEFRNQVLTNQDEMLGILRRLDEERISIALKI